MRRVITGLFLLSAVGLTAHQRGHAQDKSVRPGINDPFKDPNVGEWVTKFEGESREVYDRRKEVVAACKLKPGMAVADVGAGTGLFTRLFAEAVGREGAVYAVDISQKFLAHIAASARKQGFTNVKTVLGTDTSAGLPAASVDVVFVCDTYHHFEYPARMLESIREGLKPGGRVVLIDFVRIPGRSSDWVLKHVRAGQDGVEREFTAAGFRKAAEVKDLLKENYFMVFEAVGKGDPTPAAPAKPELAYPLVPNVGGVVPLPKAAGQPRKGAKVVFDVTADAKPGEVNKGLERAARLLNLYGAAGLTASDVKVAVVLHGEATKSVLGDVAYRVKVGADRNPSLAVIGALRAAGVEVFVCGQALAYKGFAEGDVARDVPVAVAALTVIVNRQSDGYAYVPVP